MQTISEAVVLLFNFFIQKNIYTHSENYKDLLVVNGLDKELNQAIINKALEHLEKQEIVKQIGIKTDKVDTNYWVLVKPLSAIEQGVTISGETAMMITQTINSYCASFGDEKNMVNPLSITEKDIMNLLIIIQKMLGNNIVKETGKEE